MREGRRREEWTIRKEKKLFIIIIKEWGICRNPEMKKTKKEEGWKKWEGDRVVLMVKCDA